LLFANNKNKALSLQKVPEESVLTTITRYGKIPATAIEEQPLKSGKLLEKLELEISRSLKGCYRLLKDQCDYVGKQKNLLNVKLSDTM